MDTQYAMKVILHQKFKHVQIITGKDELIKDLNETPVTPILKFIVSSEQATSLCHLVKDKSRNYDIYELDITRPQSIRKSSNTWFTYNNITKLFKTIFEDLNKDNTTAHRNKETSDNDHTCQQFLAPLGIFNSSSIPKLFHILNKESSTFLLFQLLNKIIIEMEHKPEDLEDMWFFCRQKYATDNIQLTIINEFAKNYLSTEAIRYYTKSSFLHRSLNEVFRRENTDDIYEFRSYISDLHRQLKSLGDELRSTYQHEKITVYRGKSLPIIVLQQLKKLYKSKDMKDKLISINGFLSTTRKKKIAEIFAGISGTRDGYESVIFKMHIDRRINNEVPYAYIANINVANPDEKEFLFSMGSVWQIASVKRNKAAVWTIVLRLCYDFDAQLTGLHEQILGNQLSYHYHLFLLAKISHELGKYSQAGRFYHSLLKEKLSNDFENLIYFNLATMKGEQGEYTEAQQHLKKIIASNKPETIADNKTTSHSLRPIYANTKTPSKVTIWNSMGLLHQKKDEYGHARNSFQTALEQEGSLGEKAIVHNNLGNLEKFYGENMKIAHEHLKKAVELAENTVWSKKFKEDLESLECLLSENETHNQN